MKIISFQFSEYLCKPVNPVQANMNFHFMFTISLFLTTFSFFNPHIIYASYVTISECFTPKFNIFFQN